jgi:hypothetical protein
MNPSSSSSMSTSSTSVPAESPALCGNVRIQTTDGVFTAESLYGTYFHITSPNDQQHVATVELTDEQPVYCVTTEQHRRFNCSADQKWLTLTPQEAKSEPLPKINEEVAVESKEIDNNTTEMKDSYVEPTESKSVPKQREPETDVKQDHVAVNAKSTNQLNPGTTVMTTVVSSIGASTDGTYTDGFVIGYLASVQNGMLIWNIDAENKTTTAVISRWILDTDNTVVSRQNGKNGRMQLFATSEKLREKVSKYGISSSGIPTSVWSYSENFRHGYIDALMSASATIHSIDNDNHFLELKSDVPTILNDISDLLNMYGIVNMSNGEHVRISTAAFSKIFQLSNPSLQSVLNKSINTKITTVSSVKIVSVEKTEKNERMFKILVNCGSTSLKTSLGFTA